MRLTSIQLFFIITFVVSQSITSESTFNFQQVKDPTLKTTYELRAQTIRLYDITGQLSKQINEPVPTPPLIAQDMSSLVVPAITVSPAVLPIAVHPVELKQKEKQKTSSLLIVGEESINQKQFFDKSNSVNIPSIQQTKSIVIGNQAIKPSDIILQTTTDKSIITKIPSALPSTPHQQQTKIISPSANLNNETLKPPGNPNSIPSLIPQVTQPLSNQSKNNPLNIPIYPTLTPTQTISNQQNQGQLKRNTSLVNNFPSRDTKQAKQLFPEQNKERSFSFPRQNSQQNPFTNVQPTEKQQNFSVTVVLLFLVVITVGTILGVGCLVMKRRRNQGIQFFESSAIREDIQTPKLSKVAPYNETESNFGDMVEDHDVTHND